MSSSLPTRWSSRALLLVVLLLLPALLAAPGAAAQPPLVAVPAGSADGQVRLVVQVPGGPVPPDAISASVNGKSQDARAEPLLSGRLATALVVDASTDGGPMLPVGLAGGANLVLAAPPTMRSTLVTDSTPPVVALPWPSGPADTLRALSDVRAGGARSTAAALDLAVAQLRAGATDPRLVVLYTGAPDAGGEPAATVVERMRAAGVVLAVVGSGETASPFWTAVAEGTGGMAVTAGPSGVIGAFDQVTAALGTRYLLTFPVPAQLPATVSVQVDTAGGPLSTEATVTPAAPPPGSGGSGPVVAVVIGGIIAVVLVAGAVVLVRRRAGGRRPGSVVAPVWGIPPLPADLVDRAAVRADVMAAVQRGAPVWLRPHPHVEGLGTTTAMLDFAHRHRDRYDIAWWVPARDADLVPDRLAELAEALGLATATDSAERAATALLEALSRRNRWLLVFDDAAGPRQLARYLPDGPGHVLISSSDAGWQERACPVSVPAFTRAESVSLLRSRCPDLSAEAADRVAARLDDLPLAVDPAAAVLADPDTEVDAVLDALPGAPAPWESVWDLARDRLAAADPAALALLTLAAWLGPAPVPLALLTGHPDVLPEPLAGAARTPGLADHAALLDRRGLARVTDDDLVLHPMVAGLLTDRTAAEHAADGGWAAIVVRLLAAAAPDRPARDHSTWPTWRWLLPHVVAATDPARRLETVAAEVGMLLGAAGTYLAARGRSHAARALLDDAHEFDVVARLRAAGEALPGQPTSEQADAR